MALLRRGFQRFRIPAFLCPGLFAVFAMGSTSTRQRDGRLRGGSPEPEGIFLGEGDVDPLAAFLRFLNEGYN